METCLNTTDIYYKDVEEYKFDIESIIKEMILKNERLVFAVVAEKSGITRFVIRQYPELRNFILEKMVYYKEIQVFNKKINRAVDSLIRSNKSITFMSIVNKCKFNSDIIYQNQYIRTKIRDILMENKIHKK